jgi:hypothetical protein
MVPRLLGLNVISGGLAVQAIKDARNEFAGLPEGARLCTDTAILAFVRAVFHQFYTETDWTEEDLGGPGTPSDELDMFCHLGEIDPFDNSDLYIW